MRGQKGQTATRFQGYRHEHTQSVHTSARFHGNHLPQCGKACPKRAYGKILSQQQPQNSLRQSYGKGYQTQRGALGVFGSEYSVQNIKKLFDAAFSLEEGEEMLDTISRLLEMTKRLPAGKID